MKKFFVIFQYLFLLATLLLCGCDAFALSQSSIADALNWKTTKSCNEKNNFCGGYYDEPSIVHNTPKPLPYKKVPVQVTSSGPVIFRQNGPSMLQGDVIITQPGRRIHADKALLYRDNNTGKITKIHLIGNVRAQEYGKLLVGQVADYNVVDKTLTIQNGIYHIAGVRDILTLKTPFDAFGTAKEVTRKNEGVLDLKNATYSTCSPEDPSWQLSAGELNIDHTTGKGTARDVVLRFKHVPLFYSPYYSFPLNKERKSGFLTPTFATSSNFGFMIGEPYYWNIAPNYDAIIKPSWYSQRGLQLSGDFRYLTSASDGFLYSSFLTNDTEFGSFRQTTLNSYNGTTITPTLQPYLNELTSDSNQRGFIDFENHIRLSDAWTGKIYARYVSDSYYFQTFQTGYASQNTNQLPSYGELDYQGTHWQDNFIIQGYETLHPLSQYTTAAQNQYTRLPEWDFNGDYPQVSPHLNLGMSGQAVYFDYNSAYSPFTYQMPVGGRLHLAPTLSTPFNYASFYITPQLTADNTEYLSQLPSSTASSTRPTFDGTRTLPIFDIDTGAYFDHMTAIGKNNYIETLEPRFYYLYVPYLNQNSYPNFDTQLLPFSTAMLYTQNEFSGYDRLQNANQLTLGLTSHIMNAADSSNLLTATLGVIDYFEPEKVCVNTTDCTPSDASFSPITGSLSWNATKTWTINSTVAWDPSAGQMNNAQAGAAYHFLNNHIFVFNYQFVHGDPNTPFDSFGYSTNSSLITAGLLWPLTQHWSGFGYTYYDMTHDHPVNQYVGLSYDTCCYALRVVGGEDYNGPVAVAGGQVSQSQFAKSVYVQLMLKGLGTAGYHDPASMLTATLPGFIDPFSNKGRSQFGAIQ